MSQFPRPTTGWLGLLKDHTDRSRSRLSVQQPTDVHSCHIFICFKDLTSVVVGLGVCPAGVPQSEVPRLTVHCSKNWPSCLELTCAARQDVWRTCIRVSTALLHHKDARKHLILVLHRDSMSFSSPSGKICPSEGDVRGMCRNSSKRSSCAKASP